MPSTTATPLSPSKFETSYPKQTFETAMALQECSPIYDLPHREGSHFSGTLSLHRESIDMLASDMKALVKKIQDLRHLGIEDSKIALPKICVLGDQSTGKSSLIEGMSEIQVPRSAGTCTRCPLEINLSQSDVGQVWSCRISLCRSYLYDGQQKIRKTPKKSQPLGPWIEQDQEEELFITLYNKEEVANALKCAQLAILNPQDEPAKYHPSRITNIDTMEAKVKFSPNIVRLDLSSPGFPNLAFYDLPGVISQAECDQEHYLVPLVENLVKQYVAQENCIVLLTLPMTHDATNSSAARIVRNLPKATSRTLGVLTKPDVLTKPNGFDMKEIDQWAEILNGNKFALGHGYYVVKNNPDPSVDHPQARLEERMFFADPPWTTELIGFQSRFGIRNLQTALSGLLLEQIQGCLPLIIKQINEKAERIDCELLSLPAPPATNVPYILCTKLNELKQQIMSNLDGGSRNHPMQKIWSHIAKDFESSISRTRPTMRLTADTETFAMQPDNPDSDCEMTAFRTTPSKRKTPGGEVKPVDAKPQIPVENKGDLTEHFRQFKRPAKYFGLEEIRNINEDNLSTGLQGQINPKAIEHMNMISVQHWVEPLKVFLTVSHKLVKDTVLEQVGRVFSQYQQTDLYRKLTSIIENFMSEVWKMHCDQAIQLYDIERMKPFTMATGHMVRAKDDASIFLRTRRRLARAHRYLEACGRLPEEQSRRDIEIRKVSDRELGPDNFEKELDIMATVRGYYEIAGSRFVDSTCQGVHIHLFNKCRDRLFQVVERELGIFETNALERCIELMAEEPERQRRRQYLVKERAKLTTAQEWLTAAKKDDDMNPDYGYPFSFGPVRPVDEDDKSLVRV